MSICTGVSLCLPLTVVLDQSPLHIAVLGNNPKLVKLLLKKGANSNQVDSNGWTPLHHSAKLSYFKVFEMLVRKYVFAFLRMQ